MVWRRRSPSFDLHRRHLGQDEHATAAWSCPTESTLDRQDAARALADDHAEHGVTGMRCSTAVAGAVNGDVFEAFVEQVLSPGLKPGDVVVMDNLSSHKRQRVLQFIENTGAVLRYRPPCSPDLNPIELVFSEIKQRLRSLATRTKGVLWQSMQAVLTAVTPSDVANCYRHVGYTLRVQ